MSITNIITDSYERKARLYPSLLLFGPVIGTGLTMFATKFSGLQSLSVAMAGCGGAFLLTQLARDLGKKREVLLFMEWGGLPSVAIFRHRDQRLDPITKSRYHKKLAGLVKNAKAPTPEQEEIDPQAADKVYAAWSTFLRINTRDKNRFTLLFQENVSYGYRRNVWGMRTLGITSSAICFIACSIQLYWLHISNEFFDETLGMAVVILAFISYLWIFRFNSNWVRVPADAYAARLAECVEILGGKVTEHKKEEFH